MLIDRKLQRNVLDQLDCDPVVNSSQIGVSVRQGTVVLSGHVPNFDEKRAAETAAGRVEGVKAVVNQITIDRPGRPESPDETIAGRVYARLSAIPSVPLDRIRIIVEDGVVTLRGDLDWQYQRDAIESSLRPLHCIRVLLNEIEIRPQVKVAAVRRRVRDALVRIAPLEAAGVTVRTKGSCVALSGSLNSWYERNVAESVARSVPGVTQVTNQIIVP